MVVINSGIMLLNNYTIVVVQIALHILLRNLHNNGANQVTIIIPVIHIEDVGAAEAELGKSTSRQDLGIFQNYSSSLGYGDWFSCRKWVLSKVHSMVSVLPRLHPKISRSFSTWIQQATPPSPARAQCGSGNPNLPSWFIVTQNLNQGFPILYF